MKTWFAASCPICTFRFPLTKFTAELKPIVYPLQLVTGGGRAKGFKTVKYVPWTSLPTLTRTAIWTNVLCIYTRLAAAYDNFYRILGFMSPEMEKLLLAARSYAQAYRPSPFLNYGEAYKPTRSADAFAEVYVDTVDYSETYALLLDQLAEAK